MVSTIEKVRHFCLKHGLAPKNGKYDLAFEYDADGASNLLYETIVNNRPCMVSRMGGIEFRTVSAYLRAQGKNSVLNYALGRQAEWWYKDYYYHDMENNTGFFPATKENLDRFSLRYLDDVGEIDLLGCLVNEEPEVLPFESPSVKRFWIFDLEPFWSQRPWTAALKGKRVLVVHPLKESILSQYEKREFLHRNVDILPQLASLEVVKSVQSLGGVCKEGYSNWFEALEWMKGEIDRHDYEVCLLGCGAYGLPLAAHVKRQGKKAVHIGGALQLLFGIYGERWLRETHSWNGRFLDYKPLMNEYWVRPDAKDRPNNYLKVESGCYW